MIQRNFKLALTAGRTIPLVIPASQYDSGEQWIFTLIDETGAKYTPATGAIIGLKSDKTAILNACTVDAAGRVVINETEQMTAAIGKNVYEILINDQTHGSANFIVMVEPRPGDNADFSDSDLSLLQQAIDGTSETAIKAGVQEWMDENLTDPTDPIVDASLSLSGAAADAKKTGDEISALKSAISGGGMTAEFKAALENLVNHVVFDDDDPTGQTYIDALHTAMYPPASLTSITALYTQSGVVLDTDSLDSLRSDLVVTANYDNGTSEVITSYVLSGTLTVGTSTITASYGGKSATFTVTVTDGSILSITQGNLSTASSDTDRVSVVYNTTTFNAGAVMTFTAVEGYQIYVFGMYGTSNDELVGTARGTNSIYCKAVTSTGVTYSGVSVQTRLSFTAGWETSKTITCTATDFSIDCKGYAIMIKSADGSALTPEQARSVFTKTLVG